jgi:hypothetical protein
MSSADHPTAAARLETAAKAIQDLDELVGCCGRPKTEPHLRVVPT